MRKLLLIAGLAVVAGLATLPAHAESGCAQPDTGIVAGTESNDGSGRGVHCVFTPQPSAPHRWFSTIPNDWQIYVDKDGNGVYNSDKDGALLANGSYESVPPTGEYTLPAGTTKVTIDVFNGCAGPACGWIGVLVAN